jgi:nuclear polyadenylated RNA-binding protein NAB2
VDWLFEEAVKENPGVSEPAERAQIVVNEAPPVLQPIPTLNTDSREREGGRRSGPPARIYNQAVGGAQKRSASNRSPSPGSTPNKIAKKSDAPSGPRAMRGDQPDGNRRSLKDRLGGFGREPPHPNQMPNQMGPGGPRFPGPGIPPMGQFGPDMQAMQGGMNPNFAMTEMLVQQNALLQGLLHTMANGMQMPMGGLPGMMPGGPGQFNGGMGPGFPDNGRGRGGSPMRGQRRLHPDGERQGNHGPPQNQVPGAPAPTLQAPAPLPAGASQLPPDLFDRPISPTLCKFGVNCSNALCRYSHPSAAASMESGVVLSTEPCPKGRKCDDKDCTLSHPSAGTSMCSYLSAQDFRLT